MIACGQCFFSIAQALAICSACATPIILSYGKLFGKKGKNQKKIKDPS